MAKSLGMDVIEDEALLWIADEVLLAPEPEGWEQRTKPNGDQYYYHAKTQTSLDQHPLDHYYQQLYLKMKYKKGEKPVSYPLIDASHSQR